MDEYESLNHTKWECKYHVVFIPKCRRGTLYGELRGRLGEVFRRLAVQKESRIEEGHRFTPLEIALEHGDRAGKLPPIHLDPFDRILIAQAQSEQLTLVTRDPEIQKYPVHCLAA